MSNTKQKDPNFTWTDSEIELLLEAVKLFASESLYNGIDWEGVKSKYEKISKIFVERYPKIKDCDVPDEEYPRSNKLEEITKERISAKMKTIRKNYKKAVDCGKRSGGGRVVMAFYDLCNDIWAGAPSTNSIESTVCIVVNTFCFHIGNFMLNLGCSVNRK
jgi:hypothetical protein